MTYTPPLTPDLKHTPANAEQQSLVDRGHVRLFLASAGSLFGAMIKAAQYGQMVRAIHSMPDDVLKEIGVSRSQIPDYARSLIDSD